MKLSALQKWLGEFMERPVNRIKVQDLDGRIYETDGDKVLNIAPDKIESAMANPELRKLIVTRV